MPSSPFVFAHLLLPPPCSFSLSLFSPHQVVEASSSDDDSSSDSEGAVATPAAGKKEVSCFLLSFFVFLERAWRKKKVAQEFLFVLVARLLSALHPYDGLFSARDGQKVFIEVD